MMEDNLTVKVQTKVVGLRKCPLLNAPCLREECELWLNGRCSIVRIAQHLEGLLKVI